MSFSFFITSYHNQSMFLHDWNECFSVLSLSHSLYCFLYSFSTRFHSSKNKESPTGTTSFHTSLYCLSFFFFCIERFPCFNPWTPDSFHIIILVITQDATKIRFDAAWINLAYCSVRKKEVMRVHRNELDFDDRKRVVEKRKWKLWRGTIRDKKDIFALQNFSLLTKWTTWFEREREIGKGMSYYNEIQFFRLCTSC